jgi:predicted kinase
MLIMVGGLMGTGKSTLARALQHELGCMLFSSDIVRKRLAHRDPTQPQADAFGQGVYSAEWTARTYHALRAETSAALEDGHSVVLDASFLRRADRQAVAHEATARGAHVLFVECICPREVVLQRLAQRWKARMEGEQLPGKEASFASDGRPDLYDAQCTAWEPFSVDKEPQVEHVLVTTTLPIAVTLEQVLDTLHIPRLACWLA